MDLSPGTLIPPDYEVVRPLGRGGMGAVYEVVRRSDGTRHALKVLPRVDEALGQRLRCEGQLQGALHHPGVVRVTDTLDLDGHPALVLELVPGGHTLAHRLQEGPLDHEEVDTLAEALFQAVGAAHAHGLVHRDLKPANILLAASGPRITDFGLAKALGDHGSVATTTGALLGTPAYMAPEQVQDAKRVDARADLFSLGAVLYELLTGDRAFPGAPTEAMWRAAQGEVAPLSPHEPRHRAVMWALRPRPTDRPASVEAMREAWRGDQVPPAAGASTLDDCPLLDDLLARRHDADMVAHLARCVRCRVELRLYDDFADDAPPSSRAALLGRWALGALLGCFGALAAMAGVVGGLQELAMAGPFLLLMLLIPLPAGAGLAHAIVAARGKGTTSLVGWYLGAVLILAVGAVATAVGAEEALAAIARSAEQGAPAVRQARLAAQAAHVALSTWTIGYAAGLLFAAVPPVALVLVGRDRAADPGFDALPAVVGVVGAATLWLAEGSPAGLIAFAAATFTGLLLALVPAEQDAPTRFTVAVGAAGMVAFTPIAARVELLRRAVLADDPLTAWHSVVDGWSLGWAALATVLAASSLRHAPPTSLATRTTLGQLLLLVTLALAPTAWTVQQMRLLGTHL